MTKMDHAVMPNEHCVVQQLRKCVASSLEDVSLAAGLDWAFSLIDRLSRAGSVVLKRNGADYRVSLEQGT